MTPAKVATAPWLAERWQDASDPPQYAEHNARIRYEARRDEIHRSLMGAIKAAAEDFAEMGMDADEAGGWLEKAFELADWAEPFQDEPTCGCTTYFHTCGRETS